MKRQLFAQGIRRTKFLALTLALLTGCGSPGAPAPPSLNLPAPVQDLTAVRSENSVQLTWTTPTRSTDHVVLKHPISAEICRKLDSGPCAAIATVSFKPGQPANYMDHLPVDLERGPARLLTYEVNPRNHARKSAGSSNPAISAAGMAPAALTGLTAQVRRDGVLLSWHPATETETATASQTSIVFSIQRKLMATGNTAHATSPQAANVELVVHVPGDTDPGHALDETAQPNQKYQYVVGRVATLTLAGHSIQVHGQPSDPIAVPTADVLSRRPCRAA